MPGPPALSLRSWAAQFLRSSIRQIYDAAVCLPADSPRLRHRVRRSRVTTSPADAIVPAPMTARRFTFAPSGLPPAEAKVLARRAYARARAAGSLSSVVVDKLWSDTLLAVTDAPPTAAAEMLRRTAHLFVLIEDRANRPR
jgi:hypothetical protein